jgi:hypothetical protein
VLAISYYVLTFFIRSRTFVVWFGSYWCHLKVDDQGNIELKFKQDPLHIFWTAAYPSLRVLGSDFFQTQFQKLIFWKIGFQAHALISSWKLYVSGIKRKLLTCSFTWWTRKLWDSIHNLNRAKKVIKKCANPKFMFRLWPSPVKRCINSLGWKCVMWWQYWSAVIWRQDEQIQITNAREIF